MGAFAWLRRSRRPSSPPETSSSAGRHSASRRPASSSGSSNPASAQRALAACASGAARRLRHGLRPVLASALLALALLAGLPTGAQAQVACSTANADGSYNVPFDWALKPSGLTTAGTKFRLLFATSTSRDASATDIATYNTYVQTRAKAGHSAISDSCGNLFKVVGSTSAIDARVNTDTESTDTAALIYWLNGAKVADSYTDFYDGSWDSRAHRNESGGTSVHLLVATGSNQDGTKRSSTALGAAAVTTASLSSGNPMTGLGASTNTNNFRFLGLSPIFTVGTKPVVSISAGTSPVTEGTAASFTLSVSPTPSAPLDVDVHVTDRGDFVLAANEGIKTVTVPAGAATHAFDVATDNDTADEESDSVFVTVLSGTNYTVDVLFTSLVRVTDNDATLVSLVATSDVTFTEQTPTDTAAVTVRLPRRLYAGENLAVPVEFPQDTASGITLQDDTNPSFTLSVSGTGATGAQLTGGTVYVRFTGHDTDIVQEATVTVTPTSNDDGNTAAGSLTMELSTLASGEWTRSFTTVGGGGAPHGTDDEVRLVYADNDVMFDTLTLVPLGGPRIHLDIGTSPGLTGSGRDWTLEEGTDIVLRFSNLTRTLHSQDLVVNYAVAGAKHHVPDGHRGTRTVTLPANTRSVQVTLPTEATTDDETDAELSVMLLAATPPEGTTDTQGTYTTNFRPLNFTVTDGSDGHTNRIRPLVTVETWYANPSNDPDEPDKEDPRIEGDDLQFDVRLSPAAQVPFTVWLKVEETVAADRGDCVAAGQERVRTVRFAPGVSWRTLRVPTVDDDVDEYDCEVTVSLASDAAGTVPAPAQVFVNVDSGPGRGGYGIAVGSGFDLSGKAVATRAVRDNEAGPLGSYSDDGGPVIPGAGPAVTISADRTSVTEGGDVTFTVTADPAPARDLEVTVSADEEMGSGDDRTGGGHFGTVTIRAWQTSATWTVTTISDQVALADGTVTGRIEAGDGYTVGKPFEVTVTLLDDDGVVTQSVTDPVTPGVDPALVALVRGYAAETHQGQEHVDRWMRVLAAFGDDNGYTPMTAAEAQTHADKGWQRWVPVVAALEALEAPPLTLPAVSVSAGADVTEGGDAVFTVTASPAPAAALSVTVTVATAGEFGVTAGTRTVSIPTAGSATLTLATSDDEADEPDGSVTATVAAGNGYTVGDPASGTVAIADDDPAPTAVATVDPALVAQVRGYAAETWKHPDHVDRWKRVLAAFGDDNGYTAMTAAEAQTHADKGWQRWVPVAAALAALEAAQQPLTLPAVSVSAGADVTEGGDAAFTITASPAPASPLSVTVTVATAGEFGVTAGSRTVPIPTTGSATLTLATSDDEVDEADGSVSVTVAAGNGYTVGDPASGTVAIADDDAPLPAIAVSAGDAVTEGGDATFTVTASPAPASPLAVSVTVAVDGDYGIASGTRTVSIPTAGSATLTLATSDDAADEPDGSVTLTVAAGDGYTVRDPASGSVSIADDDLPPPAVSIAAKAASVTEGGAAAFTLTADRAPDADLTVTLSVAETGGGDHVAAADEGPATAVIAKGATEAIFSVATVDDDVDEPDGSVTVTLKDGGGYTVSPSPGDAAAVTVSDNDAAALPSLSVADVTIEEDAWMEFTVRLSAPSAGGVSVKVSTRDSTPVSATARKDYWPLSGRTVSFRAGETERSVGVIVFDDSHDEEAETFEFVLSDARGAAIADGVAVGTIVNDDPMPAAWLARFGRTVAEQALDGIAGRMAADRTAGMQGSIAGQALSFDPAANDNPGCDPGPCRLRVSGLRRDRRAGAGRCRAGIRRPFRPFRPGRLRS